MFHGEKHSPENQLKCKSENQKTFVDDNSIITTKQDNKTLSESVMETMKKVQIYMESNQLELNPSKTAVMVVSKNRSEKEKFKIMLGGKEITHSKNVRLLGNYFNDKLSWENHVKNELLPSLKYQNRTLKINTQFLKGMFRKQYVEAVFKSKLNFGMENWGGGVSKSTLNLVKKQMNIAAKLAIGPLFYNKSDRQRAKIMSWLPIQDEIKFTTMKMAYQILNKGIPEEISVKAPMYKNGRRIQEQRKFYKKNLHG